MKLLITGGAGYIGSFMTKRMLEEGHAVTVVDNLERGQKEVIDLRAQFIQGNLLDASFVSSLFSSFPFDAVIHFAGYISMAESMQKPGMYFNNNTFAVLNILESMLNSSTAKFIFSSTAGVYGNPIRLPIQEDHPLYPTNPYGESKLMVERILRWYQKIHGINSVCLRYFNASGAALDGSMGENHHPESHIIPNAMRAALRSDEFMLYGDDYNTPDSTAIRDYIHVLDLVEAHVLALKKLEENGCYIYNVGTGKGYSNKEVISMIKKKSGIDFKVKVLSRRLGDAEILVADPTKIGKELSFKPVYSDLETIISSAWKWHKNNSKFIRQPADQNSK